MQTERCGRALLLLLAGCEGSQSALDPQGPQAGDIYTLWNVMFVSGIVVFVLSFAFVVAGVTLRKRELDPRRAWRWVVGGSIVTVLVLLGLLFYDARVTSRVEAQPHDPLEIEVTGRMWWWDFQYQLEPTSRSVRVANEIYVPVGRPVRFVLTSADVIHSFWVPNLHGKTDTIPGRTTSQWFRVDRPGVYRGQCAEFCGLQHANMAFVVVAVPADEFEAWLERQIEPAPPPADATAEHGQRVFLEKCGMCHAVRGTLAMAAVAPDLTHIASRRTLASGILPNRRGHMGGWILDPQQIKPGAFMPPVPLASADLHALLHYLETLR
jgi:cytochrome c oxidase subunit II